MSTENEYVEFFMKIRKFENEDNNFLVIPKVMDICFEIAESNPLHMNKMKYLLYGLHDESKRFDMTQFIFDVIISMYYKSSGDFFNYLINNLNIIYPHAVYMTNSILGPIIYDDKEARKLLCESLESTSSENLTIFKEIYLQMVEEDHTFFDECIMSKLNSV